MNREHESLDSINSSDGYICSPNPDLQPKLTCNTLPRKFQKSNTKLKSIFGRSGKAQSFQSVASSSWVKFFRTPVSDAIGADAGDVRIETNSGNNVGFFGSRLDCTEKPKTVEIVNELSNAGGGSDKPNSKKLFKHGNTKLWRLLKRDGGHTDTTSVEGVVTKTP